MKLELVSQKTKLISNRISAASGIEFYKGHYYVIGDNSPSLFKLNENLEIVNTFKIVADVFEEPIPKKLKPDFEATAIITIANQDFLLIFGSGSKTKHRNLMLVFNLQSEQIVNTYNLLSFYQYLKQKTGAAINIEGAVASENKLVFFNRANNQVYAVAYEHLITEKFLNEDTCIHFCNLSLPVKENQHLGVSGAFYDKINDLIFCTASIEQTSNWIDDGKILGSYLVVINLTQVLNNEKILVSNFLKLSDNLKIESLCLNQKFSDVYQFLMVADPDNNESIFVELNIRNTVW